MSDIVNIMLYRSVEALNGNVVNPNVQLYNWRLVTFKAIERVVSGFKLSPSADIYGITVMLLK